MNSHRSRLARSALVLAAILAAASCPNPVDSRLLLVAEDNFPPVIDITSPLSNTTYKASIVVAGRVSDSAIDAGDGRGGLASLTIKVLSLPSLNRTVTFNSDGTLRSVTPADPTFTYSPSTGEFGLVIDATALGGAQTISFIAVDRNDNQIEEPIILFDDPTGPELAVTSPLNLSEYGGAVTVSGEVHNSSTDDGTGYIRQLAWSIVGDATLTGTLDVRAGSPHDNGDGTFDNGSFVFDSATGAFSDSFSTLGKSGTLGFSFTATDLGNDSTFYSAQLLDNQPGPELTLLTYPIAYSSAVTASGTVTGTVLNAATLKSAPNGFKYEVRDPSNRLATGVVTDIIDNPDPTPDTFSFTFSYDPPGNSLVGTLSAQITAEDLAGRREYANFTISDDPIAPVILTSALSADNATLDITFDDLLYSTNGGSGALAWGDFQVNYTANGGTTLNLAGCSATRTDGSPLLGGETAVRLNLSYNGSVTGAETIEVRPAAAAVFDEVGNPAPTTTTTGVRNLYDQESAGVDSVSSLTPSGHYNAGDGIEITVQFSEPVFVIGTPTLLLETGATDQSASYDRGSGSSTLVFLYEVQGGDTAADLEYRSTGALAGTIKDASGLLAVLTLPAPGGPGSLSANRDLVIDTTPPAAPLVSIEAGADNLINSTENAAPGVLFTISGEVGATYAITRTNCTVTEGNSGILTESPLDLHLRASAAGAVNVSVVLTDAAGNAGPAGTDATPPTADLSAPSAPNVTIVDGDGKINIDENTTGPYVEFTIAGTLNNTYTITPSNCTVIGGNSGTFTTATVSRRLTADDDGLVTLSVVQYDPAGNPSPADSDTSTADLTAPPAPTVEIGSGANGDGLINIAESGAGVTLTVSGEPSATFAITLDNATFKTGTATGTLSTAGLLPSARTLSAVGSATVNVSVVLTDAAGNAGPAGTDATPPTADLGRPSAPTVTIDDDQDKADACINIAENAAGVPLTISGEAGTTYTITTQTRCAVDGAASGPLTGGSVDLSLTLTADTGSVVVKATLTDPAGNVSTEGTSAACTADLVRPATLTVSISDTDGYISPAENTPGVNTTISGATSGLSYEVTPGNCTFDGSASITTGTFSSTSLTKKIVAAANGAVTVSAVQFDAAGNPSLAAQDTSLAYITAPAAPAVTIDAGVGALVNKAENDAGVSYTVSGAEGTTYTVTLTNCTATTASGTLGATAAVLSFTATGTSPVNLSAVLAWPGGATSAAGTDSVNVDLEPPAAPTVSWDGPGTTWSWTHDAAEGADSYQHSLDGGAWSAETSANSLDGSGLGAGTHTLDVQERDANGNWSDSGHLEITLP